jgi:hypothetical protein
MTDAEWPELKTPRPRRYVRASILALLRPLFRHSASRDAYVLRVLGNRWGPVLREDRRRERRRGGQLVTE